MVPGNCSQSQPCDIFVCRDLTSSDKCVVVAWLRSSCRIPLRLRCKHRWHQPVEACLTVELDSAAGPGDVCAARRQPADAGRAAFPLRRRYQLLHALARRRQDHPPSGALTLTHGGVHHCLACATRAITECRPHRVRIAGHIGRTPAGKCTRAEGLPDCHGRQRSGRSG